MKKSIIYLVIVLTLCLAGTALAIDIDTDDNSATDILFGGTNATTANDALTNLGAESETHATEHNNGGADEVTIDPSQIPCNEGLDAHGGLDNKLECTAYTPNLTVTVNLEDADCTAEDVPYDCCTGVGTGSCDDTMSMLAGYHGIAAGSVDVDQWDAVYVKAADSELYDADGDLAASWPALGLATADGVDGTELVVLKEGCVRNDAWGWGTLGPEGWIYLSDDPTTTNGLTQTPLATAGDCHQIVGWAYSDDVACFDFGRPYSEVE